MLTRRQLARASKADIETLALLFMRAGTAAVRAEIGTLKQAASAVDTARVTIASARQRQAIISRPRHETVVHSAESSFLQRALEAHRRRLLRIPGVVGLGVGVRWCAGTETDIPCITVFVTKKRSVRSLARTRERLVPQFVEHQGVAVPLDVVEFGKLRRFTRGGSSLGVVGSTRFGTIGSFAVDNVTELPVALTAMHVTGLEQFPPGPAVRFNAPRGGAPLGVLAKGKFSGLDAAKIALSVPSDAELEIEGIGPVRGWRPINVEGDRGAPVRMRGAVSGLVAGRIDRPLVALPSEDLPAAILVNIESASGDSGAALVDNQNLVLGLLVGEATSMESLRVFTPIGAVLRQLNCDIPTSL